MTIDKQKLKALAEALIKATDAWHENEQDNELGDLWHVADDNFTEACTPAAVLTLLAEIEQLAAQVRLAGVAAEMTVHQEVGRAVTQQLALAQERDQLKAENEGLRNLAVGKVICDLDLFEDLRDSAAEEAAQYRQAMGSIRQHRQEALDDVVRRCDELIKPVKAVSHD